MMALHGTLVCDSGYWCLGLLFPVVCSFYVFDQSLPEQLYRDKGLLGVTLLTSHPNAFWETKKVQNSCYSQLLHVGPVHPAQHSQL